MKNKKYKRYQTDAEKRQAKKQQDQARAQSRVYIKDQIQRWESIGRQLLLISSEDIAKFLLDLYDEVKAGIPGYAQMQLMKLRGETPSVIKVAPQDDQQDDQEVMQAANTTNKSEITDQECVDMYVNIRNSSASESDNELVKCDLCQEIFPDSESLKQHILTHSSDQSSGRPLVNTETLPTGGLQSIDTYQPMETLVKTEGEYGCILCHKAFSDSDTLREHILKHDSDKSYASNTPPGPSHQPQHIEVTPDIADSKEEYTCDICQETFSNVTTLQHHFVSHCSDQPFPECIFCKKVFTQPGFLLEHVSVHVKHKCVLCWKTFSQVTTLQKHLLTHTNPHVCGICGKRYQSPSILRNHMLTHVPKSFKCGVCQQTFTKGNELNQHWLTHTNSGIRKKFKCNICDKKFLQAHSVKRHMLTHSGEKPHECSICKKSFSLAHTLKCHMLVHEESSEESDNS